MFLSSVAVEKPGRVEAERESLALRKSVLTSGRKYYLFWQGKKGLSGGPWRKATRRWTS